MSRTPRRTDTPFQRLLRRAAWATGIVALLVFAAQGGEFSTFNVIEGRARRDRLRAETVQRRADLNSLKVELKAVTTDPVRLERLARENYGMVRGDKELLYLLTPPARTDGDSLPVRDAKDYDEKRETRRDFKRDSKGDANADSRRNRG